MHGLPHHTFLMHSQHTAYRTECISGISANMSKHADHRQLVPSTVDLKRVRRLAKKSNMPAAVQACTSCKASDRKCHRNRSCLKIQNSQIEQWGRMYGIETLKTNSISSPSIFMFASQSIQLQSRSPVSVIENNNILMQQQLIRGFNSAGFRSSGRFQGLPPSLLTAMSRMLNSAQAVAQAHNTFQRDMKSQINSALCVWDARPWEKQALDDARLWEANNVYGFLQVCAH